MPTPAVRRRPDPATPLDAASVIVSYLDAIGTRFVFGVPGGAVEPLYNALAVSGRHGGPEPVVARHEAGAAFMADGYARESGKLGVCCATSGPGATNLLTAVACAYENNVPLLVLTGQPALPLFGRRALQESGCTGIDTVGMFKHCTRYNTLVSHPEQLEHKLVSALAAALRSPLGPVHMSIPVDILRTSVTLHGKLAALPALLEPPNLVDGRAVRELFERLSLSAQPAFVIGRGSAQAIEPILAVAETLGAAFVVNPDAKGLINPAHPLYRGVFGFGGHPEARAALRAADLVLAVGLTLGEWTSAGWSDALLNARLVHVDETREHFARSGMADLHVAGRVRTVFEGLLELDREAPRGQGLPRRPSAPSYEARSDVRAAVSLDSQIKPQQLMHELSTRFPPSTRFFVDAGNSTAWAVNLLDLQDRRGLAPQPSALLGHIGPERRRHRASWLRVVMEFAPMGWAIGAAVGGARARPECPVVCITGDGSYLMNGQEITVALQENLTVVFVVLNDGALGMVKHGQRLAGAERVAYRLPPVSYALLAQSMGVAAHVIATPADFDRLDLEAILARRSPTLLDVRIDGEEVPPMVLRLEALGTAP